jgi:cytochrome c oxidase assembly protein subunit 15
VSGRAVGIVPASMLRRLPTLSPGAYARVTAVALFFLVVIVLTGAAVRLTGSGLGCPTWPRCHGAFLTTQLDSHGAIEYGNRLFTGLVAASAIAACLLAFLRRPFRRDLAILGALLPLGVVAQAVVGGLAVLTGLKPGWVMGHFALSMLILAGAVTLAWRARSEPAQRTVNDRAVVLPVRVLLVLAAWAIFLGTTATASGPHPGASGTGEVVSRLSFHGANTLDWVIHWHGRFSTLLGLSAVATWLWAWRRGATPQLRRALTTVCVLLAAQGIVGGVQYETGLPTELVWIHVVLATLTWLSVLWSVAAAGRLAPRRRPEAAPSALSASRASLGPR